MLSLLCCPTVLCCAVLCCYHYYILCLPIYRPVWLLSVCPSSAGLSVCPSVRLSVYLSVCLFVRPSVPARLHSSEPASHSPSLCPPSTPLSSPLPSSFYPPAPVGCIHTSYSQLCPLNRRGRAVYSNSYPLQHTHPTHHQHSLDHLLNSRDTTKGKLEHSIHINHPHTPIHPRDNNHAALWRDQDGPAQACALVRLLLLLLLLLPVRSQQSCLVVAMQCNVMPRHAQHCRRTKQKQRSIRQRVRFG